MSDPNQHLGTFRRQPVTVTVASGGLLIHPHAATQSDTPAVLHYSDLRLTHTDPAYFSHGPDVLALQDSRIINEIARANPEAFQKLRGAPTANPWNWIWITIGSIAAALWLTWAYLIPAAAGALANTIPVEWEERLGKSVESGFLSESGECTAPDAKRAIEEIVQRLDRAKPSAYKFQVRISNSKEVNAFAAPGGHIVVLRGLMEAANSPEEVAGVLAHEMEHVRQRHVTRGLFRQLTLSALAGMIFGDAGALGSVVQGLGSLKFQREDEASADREGMRNLAAADLDPKAMIDFFRTLKKDEGDLPAMAEYLSNHPDTDARIEELEKLASDLHVTHRPLASDVNWSQTKLACK
jgi:beta-barrel assembly-enhancing protease